MKNASISKAFSDDDDKLWIEIHQLAFLHFSQKYAFFGCCCTHVFIRSLAQGLAFTVPYFWTSFDRIVVLNAP